jgi:hypothetical protein
MRHGKNGPPKIARGQAEPTKIVRPSTSARSEEAARDLGEGSRQQSEPPAETPDGSGIVAAQLDRYD